MDENKNNDLEEMMKKATEKVNENTQEEIEENNNPGKIKKVIVSTVAGLVLLGGIFVSAGYFMNKPQEFESKSKDPGWVEKGDNKQQAVKENWDFDFPIELKSWATLPYNKSTFWSNANMTEVLDEARKNSSFFSSISWMHTGIDYGYDSDKVKLYTHDISKRYLEDKSKNPKFTYALSEDYQKAYVTYAERLLNPVFGHWTTAQSRNSGDYATIEANEFDNLRDMFSEKWWAKNIKQSQNYSKLPVFAEWKPGDWDKFNLEKRESYREGVFYGQIELDEKETSTTEIIGSDDEGMSIVKVTSPVKFYANQKDGEIIEKSGTLMLTLQSNEDSLDVENRVVISDTSLKIN